MKLSVVCHPKWRVSWLALGWQVLLRCLCPVAGEGLMSLLGDVERWHRIAWPKDALPAQQPSVGLGVGWMEPGGLGTIQGLPDTPVRSGAGSGGLTAALLVGGTCG